MNARLPHVLAALVLHVAVIGLMLFGVQCSPRVHRPPVLEAVLLDPSRQEVAQARRAEQRRQEERRRAEAEAQKRKAAEAVKQREQEQKKQAAAEAARKKKEDDARRQKQAAEQKKLAEQKAAEQTRLAEQKKAEEAARRKQAQEEQREREAAARREREEQQRMQQAMQQEAQDREAARQDAARAESERQVRQAQWADALVRHIERNWVRPPGAADRFECRVQVALLPDGTVTSAKIVKSSGNALVDKSVEDAVFRASPLPKPADPSVFERDLRIIFIPQS